MDIKVLIRKSIKTHINMERSCVYTWECDEDHFCDRGPWMCCHCDILCDTARGTIQACKQECPGYWSKLQIQSRTSPNLPSQNENEAAAAMNVGLNGRVDKGPTQYGVTFYLCVALITIFILIIVIIVCIVFRKIYRNRGKNRKQKKPVHEEASKQLMENSNGDVNVSKQPFCGGGKFGQGEDIEMTSLCSSKTRKTDKGIQQKLGGIEGGNTNSIDSRSLSAVKSIGRKDSQTACQTCLWVDTPTGDSNYATHVNKCIGSLEVTKCSNRVSSLRTEDRVVGNGSSDEEAREQGGGGISAACKRGVSSAECKRGVSSAECKRGVISAECKSGVSVGCKNGESAECKKGSDALKTAGVILSCETLPKSADVTPRIQSGFSKNSLTVSATRLESGSLDKMVIEEVMESVQLRTGTRTSQQQEDRDETSLKSRVTEKDGFHGNSQRLTAEKSERVVGGSEGGTQPPKKTTSHPNKEIYNVLRNVDFVQGYFSQGQSIEVYINLREVGEEVALTEIATRTGAARDKFRVVHESGNY